MPPCALGLIEKIISRLAEQNFAVGPLCTPHLPTTPCALCHLHVQLSTGDMWQLHYLLRDPETNQRSFPNKFAIDKITKTHADVQLHVGHLVTLVFWGSFLVFQP